MILHNQSISWVLIAAYLLLVFFPAHLHLHHDSAPASNSNENQAFAVAANEPDIHKHETHLHVLTEFSAEDHHPAAHVFRTSPDVLTATPKDNPAPVLLFILLLAVLPMFLKQAGPRPRGTLSFACRPRYHLTPPLRAPPGF